MTLEHFIESKTGKTVGVLAAATVFVLLALETPKSPGFQMYLIAPGVLALSLLPLIFFPRRPFLRYSLALLIVIAAFAAMYAGAAMYAME